MLPASMKRIRSKALEKMCWRRFSHYNSMGAICCHGNQSSDPIWVKTYWSLSPTLMMLLIKFHFNWPTGCRDIHVWKCERTDGRTHGRRLDRYTISSPLSLRLRWANNALILNSLKTVPPQYKNVYLIELKLLSFYAQAICNHGPQALGNSGDFDFSSSQSLL